MSSDYKAMNIFIDICVPRIKLYKFMDYRFVEAAFEAAYGKDCVRCIGFFPMIINGTQFYRLEVTLVCWTEEALDMRSKLNDGHQVFLEVPFYQYVEGAKVEKKHAWKCVKLSFDRSQRKVKETVEGDYHEWSRKLQLLQPVPASVTKLEQLLHETAECARACRSNVDDALLRAQAYATTQHDCSPQRCQELVHFEEQLQRLRWHSNSIVHCLGSACEQVPHMKSSVGSITRIEPKN
jgi:hypothetical protein|uniref:Uncharacterized protein n=1 Tax=viral metagenome TaxID=1070528 RepID=A0A6C0CDX8_9ZZZZ